ncbi:MAG: J domain-containing protein [Pseudomonadota bacterium]|nr:J domain-containing protein [Pseudomonadota bacterium]
MEWSQAAFDDAGSRWGGADLAGPMDLAGLFEGAELEVEADDEIDAFGPLRVLHGWVGPAGPGAALAFPLRTDLDPEIGGIELRLRDDGRYVRGALPAFRDRHGDLTVSIELPAHVPGEERLVYTLLPYAALPRRVGDELALQAWLVEDGEPIEEAIWPLVLPDPGVRRLDNALAAVIQAATSAEAAGGVRAGPGALMGAGRANRLDAEVARLFGLDKDGRTVAAELARGAVPEGDRMIAARLRARIAPEGLPRVFGLLSGLASGAGVAAPAEEAWIAALAARLGVKESGAKGGPRQKRPSRAGPSPTTAAHLQALDLSASATWEDVRTAYRRAAHLHHPDRATPEEQAAAHERMKGINAAYTALKRGMGRGR